MAQLSIHFSTVIAFFLLQSAMFGDHCGAVTHNAYTQSTGEKCIYVLYMHIAHLHEMTTL